MLEYIHCNHHYNYVFIPFLNTCILIALLKNNAFNLHISSILMLFDVKQAEKRNFVFFPIFFKNSFIWMTFSHPSPENALGKISSGTEMTFKMSPFPKIAYVFFSVKLANVCEKIYVRHCGKMYTICILQINVMK